MMKILIIAAEEWNDYVHGNNVLTNWFTDFDAEFAEIYCSPGLPLNNICERYFRITDSEMAKSLVSRHKAGRIVKKPTQSIQVEASKQNAQRMGVYGFMKNVSLKFNATVQLMRDFIWLNGRYDEDGLKQFVQDFNPDIVYCPRMITPKLIRLEKIVSTMTSAPFVAFTADDEASESHSRNLLAKARRHSLHKKFAKHIHLYSHYFTFSQDQANEYMAEYGIPTTTLYKCADFSESFVLKSVGAPIRLVYAGRLYCNRWKSLAEIGKALQIINQNGVKMVLDVYTQEKLTDDQRAALSEDNSIYIKGCVSPVELKNIYRNADIALHVESLDEHYRMVTRVSFSTKIIDLMASTCAIMAICWEKHAGFEYLKNNDAAFCCSDYESILPKLQAICNNPQLIIEYREKAYECGKCNHNREIIHKQMLNVFEKAISDKYGRL